MIRRLPMRHCAPAGRALSWPSTSDVLNAGPSCAGALQSDCERAQSQTQAACPFSGSCSPTLHRPQPHDQTEAIPVSAATCFAASACHFATWNHADTGSRPFRPPKPFVVEKLTISPTLLAGMAFDVRSEAASRYRCRSVRLPSTAPWFQVAVAGT